MKWTVFIYQPKTRKPAPEAACTEQGAPSAEPESMPVPQIRQECIEVDTLGQLSDIIRYALDTNSSPSISRWQDR